jgi:hypothetical protein
MTVTQDIIKQRLEKAAAKNRAEKVNERADRREKKHRAEHKGLTKLRKNSDRAPKYHCDNCKCDRYSPCGCTMANSKTPHNK